MTNRLAALTAGWRRWSLTADRSEDGWETDFPEWAALMAVAQTAMTEQPVSLETLAALAVCWSAANEDEEMLEFARDHLESCWPTLEALAGSKLPGCRWQVYEAVSHAGHRASGILRRGLSDPDPYACRRALLALARTAPADAPALSEAFIDDRDPYLRLASIAMLSASPDLEFRRKALSRLASDPIDFVRSAAEAALRAP